MIRFVTMEGIYIDDTPSFGFYNTVNDKFIEFSGSVVFDSIKDFEESFNAECGFNIDRLKSLIPPAWINYESTGY
jgi:hypothetical protein